MIYPTFKDFLALCEGPAMDKAQQMDAQIAQLQARLTTLTKPVNDQIVKLQRAKAALSAQIEQEQQSQSTTPSGQQQPVANQTSTPGATANQTPGQGPIVKT